MNSKLYDRIVIGAGIVGSCTAYHLSRAGYNTLLLEQFSLNHSNGSSHGASRIIRKSYEEGFYVEWMAEAYALWKDIEEQTDQKLLIETGFFVLDEYPYAGTEAIIRNFGKVNIPYKIFSNEEFLKEFPQMRFPDEIRKFYEPSGGILLADRCKSAVLDLCRNNKTDVIEECTVSSLEPGDTITLHTNKGDFHGLSVIVCAGVWTRDLLHKIDLEIPVQPERTFFYYWKEKEAGSTSAMSFPCVQSICKKGFFYSTPSYEWPGYMKLARHVVFPCTVEDKDEIKEDPRFSEIEDFVKKHFPALEHDSSSKEQCMYSTTPDSVCIIDHHPKYRNIFYATGFSGSGFKKAPVVGRILSDMSSNKDPGYNMGPFKLNRFGS